MSDADDRPTLRSRWAVQGITPAQFLFQLLIVTAGVYIAILVQNRAESRTQRLAAEATLAAIKQELLQDENAIRSVITSQQGLQKNMDRIAADARDAAPDTAIAAMLPKRTLTNRTFFSQRAAYATLLSSGHLRYIDNAKLRLRLAEIYEHDYARIDRNGSISDQIYQGLFRAAMLRYWDYVKQRPIEQAGDAAIQLSNACLRVKEFSVFYVELLQNELNALAEVREMIHSSQDN